MEDVEMDVCGDFFDHIDDLLDFPNEDIGSGAGAGTGAGDGLDGCWSTAPDLLSVSDSALSANVGGGSSRSQCLSVDDDIAAELSVSCEDIAQLEWLSNFVEDSFSAASIDLDHHYSGGINNNSNNTTTTPYSSTNTNTASNNNNKETLFQTSSPISVLENSSYSSKPMPLSPDTVVPGRARSKRPRPHSFSSRTIPLISPVSSDSTDTTLFLPEFNNSAESHPPKKALKKKKMMQLPLPPLPAEAADGAEVSQPAAAVRQCLHCGIQKTPQWRMGPMGPKTLCNACGVRYKSGRLFPEYRPAASPTYVASLHSNSHKKVLEMRINSGEKMPAPTPEFVRKTSRVLDCI